MKLQLLPLLSNHFSMAFTICLLLSTCCSSVVCQNREEVNAPGVNALVLDKNVLEVIVTSQLTFSHQFLRFNDAPYGLSENKVQIFGGAVLATLGVDPSRNFNIGLDLRICLTKRRVRKLEASS